MTERLATDPNLAGLKVTMTIHRATGLIAKDRNIWGKKTSSDPYVAIYYGDKRVGKTPVIKKSLNPEWEHRVKHTIGINDGERVRNALPTASSMGDVPSLLLVLYDYDKASADDALGCAIVPIALNGMDSQWFDVGMGDPNAKHYCKKAKGQICVSVSVTTLLLPDILTGNTVPLQMSGKNSLLKVGLGWQVTQHQTPIDLDVSCVAIGTDGNILLNESVYFANLSNPNGSITHSGDEREGLTSVGSDASDDREQIMIDINRLPPYVAAYVLLVTVATPNVDFAQITSTRVRICDGTTGIGFCAFRPAYEGSSTAMFCMRMARKRKGKNKFGKTWSLATIGETDPTARDFGKSNIECCLI